VTSGDWLRPTRTIAALVGGIALAACVPEGPATTNAGASENRKPIPPPTPAPATATAPARPAITAPFEDNFERAELGADWNALSPVWKIDKGRLCGRGAPNKGVWLARKLPINARIEFDAFAEAPEGDLKVELWGDGVSGATSTSYTNATSYIAIFGGWKNSKHVLARINEHGDDRLEIDVDPNGDDERSRPVSPGQPYHFKIERADGKTIAWSINGVQLFEFSDPEPLAGVGHEHVGFNDWDVPVCFDNLKIVPL